VGIYRWPDHRETLVSMNALSTAQAARYRVTIDPAADLLRPYVIADELMGGAFCSLPDASGTLKRLTFRNGKGAREWLAACGRHS
jgi:hypothetical protein